jgi:hypothetical protein
MTIVSAFVDKGAGYLATDSVVFRYDNKQAVMEASKAMAFPHLDAVIAESGGWGLLQRWGDEIDRAGYRDVDDLIEDAGTCLRELFYLYALEARPNDIFSPDDYGTRWDESGALINGDFAVLFLVVGWSRRADAPVLVTWTHANDAQWAPQVFNAPALFGSPKVPEDQIRRIAHQNPGKGVPDLLPEIAAGSRPSTWCNFVDGLRA